MIFAHLGALASREDAGGRNRMKIDFSHVGHWPPQPTTVAGFAIIGLGLFVAPEIVWATVLAGLIAIIGNDGTPPKSEEATS
jgi:hypothetical protein